LKEILGVCLVYAAGTDTNLDEKRIFLNCEIISAIVEERGYFLAITYLSLISEKCSESEILSMQGKNSVFISLLFSLFLLLLNKTVLLSLFLMLNLFSSLLNIRVCLHRTLFISSIYSKYAFQWITKDMKLNLRRNIWTHIFIYQLT